MTENLIKPFGLIRHTFLNGPHAGATVPFNLGPERWSGNSQTYDTIEPTDGVARMTFEGKPYFATGEEVLVNGERTLLWRLDA